MKNILPIIIALFFISVQTFAQKHSIGLTAGINNSNSKWYATNTASLMLRSPGGGISYRYNFSKLFHFEIDLMYNRFGHRSEINYTDIYGNNLETKYATSKFQYINAPIKGGIVLGKKLGFLFNLGVAPSFLVKSHYKSEGHNNTPDWEKDLTNDTKKINLFILGEAGLQYKISDKFLMSTSAMYQLSPMSYSIYDNPIANDSKHYSIFLNLGIKYTFQK